jgi:CxxC-x17-CxxC domain-containing protein
MPLSRIEGNRDKIIRFCRECYGAPRQIVEEKIARWSAKEEEKNQISFSQEARYETKCDKCGTQVFVPFIPDGVRPVLCKNCLREYRQTKKEESNRPSL